MRKKIHGFFTCINADILTYVLFEGCHYLKVLTPFSMHGKINAYRGVIT